MQNVGFVCFVESISDKTLAQVRDAAERAGLDATKIHDHKSRNAFIRAVRQMNKTNKLASGDAGSLVDRIIDDESVISFQFSKKYAETNGVRYDKDAVIVMRKDDAVIDCTNTEYKALANRLMDSVSKEYRVSDINGFVSRVVREKCRKVPLRDAVYFIPASQEALVGQLRRFYDALGVVYHVLGVGYDANQRGNILKAVVRDLKQNMDAAREELKALQAEGGLTKQAARHRLKDLRRSVREYRELADSLKVDLREIIGEAGDTALALVQLDQPTDALIAAIQGKKVLGDPMLLDLLVASEEAPEDLNVFKRERKELPAQVEKTPESVKV